MSNNNIEYNCVWIKVTIVLSSMYNAPVWVVVTTEIYNEQYSIHGENQADVWTCVRYPTKQRRTFSLTDYKVKQNNKLGETSYLLSHCCMVRHACSCWFDGSAWIPKVIQYSIPSNLKYHKRVFYTMAIYSQFCSIWKNKLIVVYCF